MTERNSYINIKEKEQLKKSALPIGTVLHNGHREYKVVKILGAGGFGITYKVSSVVMVDNVPITTFFALKEYFLKGCYREGKASDVLCPPTMQNDVEMGRKDFLTEARRLNRLSGKSHNIVRVNESFEENGTAYYVMEYLDGGDLQTLAERRGMPEKQAVALMLPIARAVSVVHEERILHLDIKPDNIVMKTDMDDGSSYPVLIDFGIAKHFDNKGRPTSHLLAKGASDGYAPVEQYTEISGFTPEMDVYAIGATLLFLLTGKRPVKSFDVTPAVIDECLPEGVSDKTRKAIKAAMSRFRDERTPDVLSFIRSLGDYSGEEDNGIKTESFKAGRNKKSAFRHLRFCLPVGGLISGFRNILYKVSTAIVHAVLKFWKPLLSVCACVALIYAVMFVADSVQAPVSSKPSSSDSLVAEENYVDSMAADIESDEETTDSRMATGENVKESNDEVFSRAVKDKDYSALVNLAKVGYAKAYYPTANYYYSKKDNANAKMYAQKAVKAGVDSKAAQALLAKIEDNTSKENTAFKEDVAKESTSKEETRHPQSSSTKSMAERLKEALQKGKNGWMDIISLSMQGYAPAYFHCAKIQLQANNTPAAKEYLQRSIEAGVNVKQSKELLELLDN